VVDVDAGDDGAVGVDDVHRVEPPARPTSRITRSSGACDSRRAIASVVNSK
jgi:hypothetical protein